MTGTNMGVTKSRKSTLPQKKKLNKDPGIPKLPNLKDRNAAKQRARAHRPMHSTDPDSVMASEPTLSSLAQMALEQQALEDPSSSTPSGSTGKTKEQIRRHYLRTLHKVIDESDIVILVLDARDPEGCRSRLVEEEVRRREAEGKRLVFVLNKVDLIPRANAQAWLKHLRHSTPTLPFLSPSSAQHQKSNISSSTAPSLIKLPQSSSLINSLKRSKVCAVAAQPGHTKDLQSIQLERGMKIVDSPGVVFDEDDEDGKGQRKANILLRNVVKVEDVDDPIAVVEEILLRTSPETIRKIYNLPDFANTLEFLTMLALNSGRLLKGGTPDVTAAARHVLMDWNHQKVPYFSTPPAIHPSLIPSTIQTGHTDSAVSMIAPGAENVGQAQILTSLSKPFELDGLFSAADAGAFGGPGAPDVDMNDGEDVFWDANENFSEPMDEDEISLGKRVRSPSPPPLPSQPESQRQPKRQRKSKVVPTYDEPPDVHILSRMDKSNPLNRKVLKKERKKERKNMKQRMNQGKTDVMEVDDEFPGLEFTFMA
ncbi:P-loop containing nucleoside triphosphate hydrolase protein [Mycena floridula]|nr:P-loop containing nucleoside triphosphate hydrolase protein [Mycena floridula]